MKAFISHKIIPILALFLLTTITLALQGCFFGPGLLDWEYNLPNGYMIVRVNAETIELHKKKSNNSSETIIHKYVEKFMYSERYVCLKCTYDTSEKIASNRDDSTPVYFLFDTQSAEYIEMCSEKDLMEYITELKDSVFSEWIDTKTVSREDTEGR